MTQPAGSRTLTRAQRALRSDVAFAISAGLAMVLLRLASFDYRAFFRLQSIPNHDMSQGAPFFAASMHAVRLSGDIAWWNPISSNGYAQYYQSFFSPVAPTPGHIVFIVWAQIIRVLALGDIAFPEYYQYLTITYMVLPFLALSTFALLAGQIFRYRATVLLVLIVYTFSGIGLWNSAWFFFQETFSLSLLLLAIIALLKKPTVPRWALLIAATLVQLSSLNYWTLYNSWFVTVFVGAYCATHGNQLRRLFARTRLIVKAHPTRAALVAALASSVIIIWAVMLASIVMEQSGSYFRRAYSVGEAENRVQEMRRFTTELFNPMIQRPLESYRSPINEMHAARYIGAFLLPLLVLLPALQWGRRERWLIATSLGVLVVCLAPPFLLTAWETIPFMRQVGHLFYFYTHYWQLMIVLLAGAVMDRLLSHHQVAPLRRRLVAISSVQIIIMALVFTWFSLFSEVFPTNDASLQANLRFALLSLLTGVAVVQYLLFPSSANRHILVGIVLVLALADLTRYFSEVNRVDQSSTAARWRNSLSEEARMALRRPWAPPDLSAGFEGGVPRNMPINNDFWPVNSYISHRHIVELREAPERAQRRLLSGSDIEFYPPEAVARAPERLERLPRENRGALLEGGRLLLHGDVVEPRQRAGARAQGAAESSPAGGSSFSSMMRHWGYHSFAFEAYAPQSGWLFIRQLYDPLWQIVVDGQSVQAHRANVVGMAVPIAEGSHDIRMEYRPFARGLYWPAAVWLELVLLAMIAVAVLAPRRALSRPALSTAPLPGAATPVAMPGGRFRELFGRARR